MFLYDQLVLKEFDQCENSTFSSFLFDQWKAAVSGATRDRDRHFRGIDICYQYYPEESVLR